MKMISNNIINNKRLLDLQIRQERNKWHQYYKIIQCA